MFQVKKKGMQLKCRGNYSIETYFLQLLFQFSEFENNSGHENSTCLLAMTSGFGWMVSSIHKAGD